MKPLKDWGLAEIFVLVVAGLLIAAALIYAYEATNNNLPESVRNDVVKKIEDTNSYYSNVNIESWEKGDAGSYHGWRGPVDELWCITATWDNALNSDRGYFLAFRKNKLWEIEWANESRFLSYDCSQ